MFVRLRADHADVLRALAGVERALRAGPAGRAAAAPRRVAGSSAALAALRQLVARLARQFDTHMAAEDEVLFPFLARNLPDGERYVRPLRAEHAELRAMLGALGETLARRPGAARDEQLAVQSRDLIDLLRIHIRKEEAFVFSVAEHLLPPQALAALAARRSPSSSPPPARPARTQPTKGKPS